MEQSFQRINLAIIQSRPRANLNSHQRYFILSRYISSSPLSLSPSPSTAAEVGNRKGSEGALAPRKTTATSCGRKQFLHFSVRNSRHYHEQIWLSAEPLPASAPRPRRDWLCINRIPHTRHFPGRKSGDSFLFFSFLFFFLSRFISSLDSRFSRRAKKSLAASKGKERRGRKTLGELFRGEEIFFRFWNDE